MKTFIILIKMKRKVDLRILKPTIKNRSCSPKTLNLTTSPYAAKSISPSKLTEQRCRVQEMKKAIDFCHKRLSAALSLIHKAEIKLKDLETPRKSKK